VSELRLDERAEQVVPELWRERLAESARVELAAALGAHEMSHLSEQALLEWHLRLVAGPGYAQWDQDLQRLSQAIGQHSDRRVLVGVNRELRQRLIAYRTSGNKAHETITWRLVKMVSERIEALPARQRREDWETVRDLRKVLSEIRKTGHGFDIRIKNADYIWGRTEKLISEVRDPEALRPLLDEWRGNARDNIMMRWYNLRSANAAGNRHGSPEWRAWADEQGTLERITQPMIRALRRRVSSPDAYEDTEYEPSDEWDWFRAERALLSPTKPKAGRSGLARFFSRG
jgi:hypothetical protein